MAADHSCSVLIPASTASPRGCLMANPATAALPLPSLVTPACWMAASLAAAELPLAAASRPASCFTAAAHEPWMVLAPLSATLSSPAANGAATTQVAERARGMVAIASASAWHERGRETSQMKHTKLPVSSRSVSDHDIANHLTAQDLIRSSGKVASQQSFQKDLGNLPARPQLDTW